MAAESIGRPDATAHVLPHTHASLAADISAPTPVTMQRLGHATVSMTMRYTHAKADADQRLAVELVIVRTAGSRA
ncbi:Phage integrase family protein [Tessaracoccus bendigoensis DSM 12906]|uniref:Phage integrase family protein n=1 Tax=Tessaracoccus bendigoensis DSM 12906 TaxID=1123357 RepID=A0A1M6N0C0_9ACTN|nr:tyrosine-type recombinase/integrase [Tessaracoccus bendigoensis]SHJ89052.1 Phage integrase family protein [Tessaracoccus bendigoensis DSM 12906]